MTWDRGRRLLLLALTLGFAPPLAGQATRNDVELAIYAIKNGLAEL